MRVQILFIDVQDLINRLLFMSYKNRVMYTMQHNIILLRVNIYLNRSWFRRYFLSSLKRNYFVILEGDW